MQVCPAQWPLPHCPPAPEVPRATEGAGPGCSHPVPTPTPPHPGWLGALACQARPSLSLSGRPYVCPGARVHVRPRSASRASPALGGADKGDRSPPRPLPLPPAPCSPPPPASGASAPQTGRTPQRWAKGAGQRGGRGTPLLSSPGRGALGVSPPPGRGGHIPGPRTWLPEKQVARPPLGVGSIRQRAPKPWAPSSFL